MNGEALWNHIISGLSSSEEEIQTTTGLWFTASSRDGRLYVDRAINNSPSSELSMKRTISKKDFYLYIHIMIAGLMEKRVLDMRSVGNQEILLISLL